MNFNLDYRGFEENLFSKTGRPVGVWYEFRFDNRFGASIIKHRHSYGFEKDLWELAVLQNVPDTNDWLLTFDTPITNDVVGWCTDEQIRELLKMIKEL